MRAQPTVVPETSLLGAYARRGGFTDCYRLSVAGSVTLSTLIEAFYTTPLFRLERWLLFAALKIKSSDADARLLAFALSDRFAAWQVESRSDGEIMLAAGRTRLWLCVVAGDAAIPATTLFMGSAGAPRPPRAQCSVVLHSLRGVHRLYSMLLLAAASKRVAATAHAQSNACLGATLPTMELNATDPTTRNAVQSRPRSPQGTLRER